MDVSDAQLSGSASLFNTVTKQVHPLEHEYSTKARPDSFLIHVKFPTSTTSSLVLTWQVSSPISARSIVERSPAVFTPGGCHH